jgi:uncharacterized protein (TIGR03492 family)
MRLLCLSNGHGEDAIAVRILRELQSLPQPPELAALPIVGEGQAYTQAGIPVIGSVKTMPSGGFIYMDGRQLARDLRGGLLQLTQMQLRAVRSWVHQSPKRGFILAVGDVVPLLFAWLSGVPYAFVGTAKSEYYLRDERGMLPRQSWWDDRLPRWTGCVYYPWERWLMRRPNCKAVFPRDRLTTQILQRFAVPAVEVGNPMMDGLIWHPESSPDLASGAPAPLTIVLLPGSRPPEAYANWEILLLAVNNLIADMGRSLLLLAAIDSKLDLDRLRQELLQFRWQQADANTYWIGIGNQRTTLKLMPQRFVECIHRAELAIAMAGTATEQFVGLGKPAIIMPGKGPQFTPQFAEAQTRLLGPSVTLVPEPSQTATAVQALLDDPDRLHLIVQNGQRRMGESGASRRIAVHLQAFWR